MMIRVSVSLGQIRLKALTDKAATNGCSVASEIRRLISLVRTIAPKDPRPLKRRRRDDGGGKTTIRLPTECVEWLDERCARTDESFSAAVCAYIEAGWSIESEALRRLTSADEEQAA
ncbi:MAG: hypothetical protein ACE366_16715 [Bradymonadia bacterium]